MTKKDFVVFLFAVLTVVFIHRFNSLQEKPILTTYGSETEVDFFTASSYEEAVELSKKENKPIFIYFEADWCGYCKQMKKNVLSNIKAQSLIKENYIQFIVDIDENQDLKSNFKIKSVPSYVICSSDGEVLQKSAGYKDLQNFLNWLRPVTTTSNLE